VSRLIERERPRVDERAAVAYASAVRVKCAPAANASEGHPVALSPTSGAIDCIFFIFLLFFVLLLLLKPIRCPAAARAIGRAYVS